MNRNARKDASDGNVSRSRLVIANVRSQKRRSRMYSCIDVLLRLMDEAFDHKSWHGTNLRGALRGLTAKDVSWRPQPQRHNIWEITLHAAYWKYTVRRRLLGEKRGSFPVKGSNWFERPIAGQVDESQWKSDIALLASTHASLRNAVAELTPEDLTRLAGGGTTSILTLVTDIAAHDLYHAGQIQLLKRLYSDHA